MTGPVAPELVASLEATGFICLGGFNPAGHDLVPGLSDGHRTGSLLLIGSSGPNLWPIFCRSPEYGDGKPDPLDRYTTRVLGALASRLGYEALFPFDGPPYHPFQRWALKCGGFSQSPLGVLAHRDFGTWAGFRAVFLAADPLDCVTHSAEPGKGPCESCKGKPCTSTCPIGAVSLETGYDFSRCRAYLAENRQADCWRGCIARLACPMGTEHRQNEATARFHMSGFMRL